MNNDERLSEVQSPLQRAVVFASLACFGSLTFIYCVARPAVELLEARWAELLVYAIIPIAVTFIILYRSCWHREITGVARTSSLLLISGLILVGVIVAAGVMLSLLWFCFNAVSGGNH
jgi:hypothetical protein